jgi:hypothetical protein
MAFKTFLLTKLEKRKKKLQFFFTAWHDKNAINDSMIRKRKSFFLYDDMMRWLQQNHVFLCYLLWLKSSRNWTLDKMTILAERLSHFKQALGGSLVMWAWLKVTHHIHMAHMAHVYFD